MSKFPKVQESSIGGEMDGNILKQLAGMQTDGRRKSQEIRGMVENLSPLLTIAPGIIERRERCSTCV